MTLAQRLLVAIGVVALATAASLGLGLREAWTRAEAARFDEQFRHASTRLGAELGRDVSQLPKTLVTFCDHEPLVDSALLDLRTNRLDMSRRMALAALVPELMKALELDELLLITNEGEVLGAGVEGRVGRREPKLAQKLTAPSDRAELRTDDAPLAIAAHCLHRDLNNPKLWVGLYGARHVDPLLKTVGERYGVRISLGGAGEGDADLRQTLTLKELGDLKLTVSRSRLPLTEALSTLDGTVLGFAIASVAAALLFGLVVARGLARPIVELSRQAREVARGEPKPVQGGGGRELVELAETFNQAIADLTALRRRLAATERIAARREIARRVAHEIKNPLAPIRAAVETLRRLRARNDPAFDEYFDEATRTVLEEVARISNIVTQFTRFARLPPPSPAPLDLVEAVRSVVVLHASGGAPVVLDAAACPVVNADRDQMVQVVTNLVQNAVDASRGVGSARVDVQLFPLGADRVVLRVRDNGLGVDPEMRERLFEPYATTKAEGTGLGLAIVQRIVIEHGGEISYRDAPGGGAEFEIVLPVSGPTLLADPPTLTPMSAERARG